MIGPGAILAAAVILGLFATCPAAFNPNVTVQSCTAPMVAIRLENAAEGGLIYIQGRSSACQRTTTSERGDYEFDFETCSLEYDRKFRVVVQHDARYQTGDDKVIPVMCLVDTADLLVTAVVFPEEVNDAMVNKTVKPSVLMRLLTPSSDVIRGVVTLDDEVRMSLVLDQDYIEDFDIKAIECVASSITLIKDQCSEDEELFPNFQRLARGDLAATFRAFTPTPLSEDPDVDVEMLFTCSVSVCLGDCQKALCREVAGWGRRKRSQGDREVERVTAGATLRVTSPGKLSQGQGFDKVCAEKTIVYVLVAIVLASLLFSWVVLGCMIRKLKKNNIRLMRKSSQNSSAGAVGILGRRLSSLFAGQAGNNVRSEKIMDCLPEAESSPPTIHRESVAVSTVSRNDDTLSETDDVTLSVQDVCKLLRELSDKLSMDKESKTFHARLSEDGIFKLASMFHDAMKGKDGVEGSLLGEGIQPGQDDVLDAGFSDSKVGTKNSMTNGYTQRPGHVSFVDKTLDTPQKGRPSLKEIRNSRVARQRHEDGTGYGNGRGHGSGTSRQEDSSSSDGDSTRPSASNFRSPWLRIRSESEASVISCMSFEDDVVSVHGEVFPLSDDSRQSTRV